jgi:4-amino-4-deoxychorismate lyase
VEIRVIETIKIIDGIPQYLEFHQWRVDWSRKRLGFTKPLHIKIENAPSKGVWRCRVIYSKEIEKIEFFPVIERDFKSFSFAFVSNFDYSIKYEDRGELNKIRDMFIGESDEIIFIKNDLITDTSISNLAFFDGKNWITPRKPLLKGTTRERLILEKKIFEKDLMFKDINSFKHIAMLNSILGFKVIIDKKFCLS